MKLTFEQRAEAERLVERIVDDPTWAAFEIVGLRAQTGFDDLSPNLSHAEKVWNADERAGGRRTMTRDELVAVLKARKVGEVGDWIVARSWVHPQSDWMVHGPDGQQYVFPTEERAQIVARALNGATADAERLAEALDVALEVAIPYGSGIDRAQRKERARAAFLQSLTGPTTRETERP